MKKYFIFNERETLRRCQKIRINQKNNFQAYRFLVCIYITIQFQLLVCSRNGLNNSPLNVILLDELGPVPHVEGEDHLVPHVVILSLKFLQLLSAQGPDERRT